MDGAVNLWSNDEHVTQYLDRADRIPHRSEGEAALLEWIPRHPTRVLDLGSGDGRLLSMVISACEPAEAVAMDFSPAMLGFEAAFREARVLTAGIVQRWWESQPGLSAITAECPSGASRR